MSQDSGGNSIAKGPQAVVLFSDLDGTLLDLQTYSWEEASSALSRVARCGIPLIFCTSKTRSEVEEFRLALNNRDPFIVENGGAVYFPRDFGGEVPGATPQGEYRRLELGTPYRILVSGLDMIRRHSGVALRGFADMEIDEVARLTGLSRERARRAKRREYDEPFLFESEAQESALARAAEALGLRVTRGGRFWHLHGGSDKGRAVREVTSLYRRILGPLRTVGLGDSANDLAMLAAVDVAVLVQKPGGSYDPEVVLDGLVRAPAAGPKGWSWAVERIMES